MRRLLYLKTTHPPLISRGVCCIKISVSIWRAAEDSNPRPSDP